MTVSKKKTAARKNDPKNEIDFEHSLAELERLVTHMEQGELTLDETLKNFERGVELGRICQKALDEAEQRVRILMEKEDQSQLESFGNHDE